MLLSIFKEWDWPNYATTSYAPYWATDQSRFLSQENDEGFDFLKLCFFYYWLQNWSFLCVGLKEACNHLLLEPFFMPTYVLPFISICLSKRFRIHLASVCSQQSCFSLLSTIDIVLVKLSTRILCFQLLLHSSDILHQFAIHHDLYSLKFL